MADINHNDIPNIETDWQGYSGQSVQKFIKEQLQSKVGVFYYDATNNRYLVFASEETKNEYILNPTLTDLVLGTFDAPFNYSAEINLASNTYNAVFLGSVGNYIDFTFKIVNKQNVDTGENVNITYTFIRNSTKQTVNEIRKYGDVVHFNIDKYLKEGTNTILINVVGQNTLAATSVAITYQVINLSLSDGLDISKSYDLSKGSAIMQVPFHVSGFGTKIMEWYIDGVKQPFVKDEDEVVDTSIERIKNITLSSLGHGKHSLQIRAYTTVNGEAFYTHTLYRDFFVYTGANTALMLGVAITIPVRYGVLGANDTIALYGVEQYVPYTLKFASYSPINTASSSVTIKIDNDTKGVVSSSNGVENMFTFMPTESGNKTLTLSATGVTYNIPVDIAPTRMSLQEITTDLVMDFTAMGKSNQDADRNIWTDGRFIGTLTGFNWTSQSGWVDNRLEINAGASFAINYAPLAGNPTNAGKTIEIEWKTKNVSNDNAVICDMRNENGVGILITATKVTMRSSNGVEISTEYKSEENVRIAFVINRTSGSTDARLSFIYANGIVSRGESWVSTDGYTSNKTITFTSSDEAQVSLKAIRIYNTALTADNILNNYNLYRDTVEEMMDVYDRNDIYVDGTTSFSVEKMATRLPVMVVIGDIPTLENTTDKDTQIVVDIEYINMQDPSKSFKMVNAAMRPQGTSSMGYPKKNFRIYTQKLDSTIVYDANGNEIEDKLYSFKEGAQPVDCWCLKADYAESSGTHNTGIARLWGEALYNARVTHYFGEGDTRNIQDEPVLRTNAQKIATQNNYPWDVRTTIDGFPILLFYRPTANDDLIFIGKYNFNNDKSTESVFGFTGIPGFDNSRMQCWEILNNGHPLALFKTMENFDTKWSDAYESRYPDTKTPNIADLKTFSQWMIDVTQERFKTEKWQHLDVFKMAAYWCYLMRHAGADQFVKNAMFTSEDGEKFYFILYDNDTINGLINTGHLTVPPTADRQTKNSAGEYIFAGHDSKLWNLLEADEEFIQIVSSVDNALYSAGISYKNAIRMFDEEQADKWVEKVYNQDARYKYIGPRISNVYDAMFMLQGKRDLHRRWWLAKRFSIYDAKYVSGTYKSQAVEFKCLDYTPAGQQFTVTAGYALDYGYGINNRPRKFGVSLNAGESYTFITEEDVNIGDPIGIYGAPNIAVLDFSKMASRLNVINMGNIYDEAIGTKLTKLILGNINMENVVVKEISGIQQALALEYIDIQGMKGLTALDLSAQQYIKTVKAYGSNIASVIFAKGAPVEYLELPDTMTALQFEQLPQLSSANIHYEDISKVYSVTVKSCPNISNDFNLVWNWVTNKTAQDGSCVLAMDNVDWSGVTGEQMARVANIGSISLKGKVVLSDITAEQGELFKRVFGDSVFNENAEFYIDAPLSITLSGDTNILEGSIVQYSANVYPTVAGEITYFLVQTREGASINATTGELTVLENDAPASTIVVKATFVPDNGDDAISKELSVNVAKRVYPENISISGDGNLKQGGTFTLSTTTATDAITGEYDVVWSVTGNIAQYCTITPNGDYCEVQVSTLPPSSMNGTLKAEIKRKVDNKVMSSASLSLNYIYVYPTSVRIDGLAGIIGGNDGEYKATLSPSNVDIPVTYTWSLSNTTYASIKEQNGDTCIIETTAPDEDTSIIITCKVQTSDGKSVSNNISVNILSRPNFITATYDVTSTSSSTKLVNSTTNITYMEIDGVEVTPVGSYKFTTTGQHTIKITVLKSLRQLFYSAYRLVEVDFSECNGSVYADMSNTFYNCSALNNIIWGDCSFPKVTDISSIFYNCTQLLSIDLSAFRGCRLESISNAFNSCKMTELDFTGINTSSVVSLGDLFNGCRNLSTLIWDTCDFSNVTSITSTFKFCTSLSNPPLSPLKGAKLKYVSDAFSNAFTANTILDFTGFDFSSITDAQWMFNYCRAKQIIFGDAKLGTSTPITFINMYNLQSVDLSVFSNGLISNFSELFYKCSSLKSIDLSVVPIPANSSVNFYMAFYECTSLETIVLPNLNDVQGVNFSYAFRYCSKLNTISIPKLAKGATVDLSLAFNGCKMLETFDFSCFSDSVIKSMDTVFSGCSKLSSLNLSGTFDITSLDSAFSSTAIEELDLTIMSNCVITDMFGAFWGCTKLKTILLGWTTAPNVPSSEITFGSSSSDYTGRDTYNTGLNMLYVPIGATGYDTGVWLDPLQNTSKCGFTISATL